MTLAYWEWHQNTQRAAWDLCVSQLVGKWVYVHLHFKAIFGPVAELELFGGPILFFLQADGPWVCRARRTLGETGLKAPGRQYIK